MQKTDFHEFELFAEKVILELKCTKSLLLELLRTPILCLVQLSKLWECEATDAQKLLSQWEKVAKCNFRSKAQVHEKCFFLMKWTVFCNAETDFHEFELFCRKSHFRSLNAQNHFFRASKNTNTVFSATKQIMRMRGHRCSKTSFSVRKSC